MSFKRVNSVTPDVKFNFDDQAVFGCKGDSVAAALLGANIAILGKRGATENYRAPYCMMGTCFDCLVKIDGVSVQACQVEIREGLCVSSLHSISNPTDSQD
ncbi:MAG: (2Fe-2S)-binding protein [Gammaproteobacteria bacterium]|nr:(2Fe-2S)-binding protein [Gammaproteobacteria bacterium]